MTDLEQSILREIQEHHDVLVQTHPDPTRVITTLQSWNHKLKQANSSHHLVWCFAPDLCLWLGPVVPVKLRTTLARRKLEHIPIWSLEQEVLELGSSPADTLVLSEGDSFTIYCRPQRYLAKFKEDLAKAEPAFLQLLDAFASHEDFLLWRRELNLVHEWGHIVTDTHLSYKEPLLNKLENFQPPDALLALSWIKMLLEMLADLFPEEGALFLLPELGQAEPTRDIARMLLLDRLLEYHQNGLAAEFLDFYTWSQQITSDSQPDWESFYLCCARLGEILQEQLMQAIQTIPQNPADLGSWVLQQQQSLQQESLEIF